MPPSVLLVEWAGGLTEIDSGNTPRVEAALDLGSSGSLAEVTRVALAQLDDFGRDREQIGATLAGYDPVLQVGATIQGPDATGTVGDQKIIARTVTQEETGRAVVVLTLADSIIGPEERLSQAQKKMIGATLAGQSIVASPVSGNGNSQGVAVFGGGGGLTYQWVLYEPDWVSDGSPPSGAVTLEGEYRLWSNGEIDAIRIRLLVDGGTTLGTGTWGFVIPDETMDFYGWVGQATAYMPGGDNVPDSTGTIYTANVHATAIGGRRVLVCVGETDEALSGALRWGGTLPENSGDPWIADAQLWISFYPHAVAEEMVI